MIDLFNIIAPLLGLLALFAVVLWMLAYPKNMTAFNICLTIVITFALLGVFCTSMFLLPMIVFLVLLPACDRDR